MILEVIPDEKSSCLIYIQLVSPKEKREQKNIWGNTAENFLNMMNTLNYRSRSTINEEKGEEEEKAEE